MWGGIKLLVLDFMVNLSGFSGTFCYMMLENNNGGQGEGSVGTVITAQRLGPEMGSLPLILWSVMVVSICTLSTGSRKGVETDGSWELEGHRIYPKGNSGFSDGAVSKT